MKTIFISFITCILLTSCSESSSSYFTPSGEFISSNVSFNVIDTISFEMSTFKFDSLTTDVYNKILVGQYNDPYFGKTTANGFANFVPSSYSLDNTAVFDSIVLNLEYSGYFYNDTLLQKNINIYELEKKIRFRNNQINFYNTNDIEVIGLVGQRTFYPRISKDSIKITLNNSLGSNLFYKIRNGVINNNEELSQYFKGLKIAPSSDENAAMISFNINNSYLRFYYSYPNNPGVAYYYDFTYTDFNTNRNHFSQILSDRTGTNLPIDFINQENELYSENANNLSYIQAGVGITTKITFPNFKESMLNLEGTIYKADLKIPLDNNLFTKKTFTGDSLRVYIVDINNEAISTLTDSNGTTVNAYIQNDDPEFNETYINISITPFLQDILTRNYYKDYGIILMPFDYGIITNRLILNGNKHPQKKSKLKLTLLNYDN